MSKLQEAVDAGKALGKTALYFGCWDRPGHFWHDTRGHHLWDRVPNDLPKSWLDLADGSLLQNGKHADVYDGRVWWTCGGLALLAIALGGAVLMYVAHH